jgi:hypothetical protein
MESCLGLVDGTGTEKGRIHVKSRAAAVFTRIGEILGKEDTPASVGGQEHIVTTATPSGEAKQVLRLEADDCMFIVADFWP